MTKPVCRSITVTSHVTLMSYVVLAVNLFWKWPSMCHKSDI